MASKVDPELTTPTDWAEGLPAEVLAHLLERVSLRTLAGSCAAVCTSWRQACDDEAFWCELCRRVWRVHARPPARSKLLFRTCLAEYTSMTAQRMYSEPTWLRTVDASEVTPPRTALDYYKTGGALSKALGARCLPCSGERFPGFEAVEQQVERDFEALSTAERAPFEAKESADLQRHGTEWRAARQGNTFAWTGDGSQSEGDQTVGVAILGGSGPHRWPHWHVTSPSGFEVMYYEVEVVDPGEHGYVAVGWAQAGFERKCKQPGWTGSSFGYHGDDGGAYSGSGFPRRFGPKFNRAGAVVGTGLIRPLGSGAMAPKIFFTLDGELVGTPFSTDEADEGAKPLAGAERRLRPCVGLHSAGERVRINWGGSAAALLEAAPLQPPDAFRFDLAAYISALWPSGRLPAEGSGEGRVWKPIAAPPPSTSSLPRALLPMLDMLPWAVQAIFVLVLKAEPSVDELDELRHFAAMHFGGEDGTLHPSWGARTVRELPVDALRHLVRMLIEHTAQLREDEDDDDDDDDEDEEGEEGGDGPGIHTAMLDEKAAAIHCLGACAAYGGASFAPHIEAVMGPLLGCADHFHEDVRGALARTLSHLVKACAAAEPPQPWVKGEAPASSKLGKATRWLLQRSWRTLVSTFKDDDDKDTVAAAAESISEIVLLLGPSVLANAPWHPASTDPLVNGALALLEQRHSCQEAAQDLSEGGGVDEEEDHDEAVWEAVSELLTTLPKALGERWTPHLERLLPALLPYLREAHPLSDHALAIGILAEGLNHVEASGRHHLPTILPHAARCASAPDPTCRQNGVFCLGVLGAHGGEAALAQMQPILSALQQRLSAQEEDEAVVRDNAVGALSRIALSFGAALPLDAVLRAIADRLPLTEDEGENAPALRCLMQLLHAEETRAVAAPHMPALLKAIGHLLAGGGDGSPAADAGPRPCPLDAECEAEVRSFLVWAAGQSPQEMQALVMDLPRGREQVLAVLQAHQG